MVPIITHFLLKATGIDSHPISENKRKAMEILAAVFGVGSEKIADGEREERTGVVTSLSENQIAIDFRIELF